MAIVPQSKLPPALTLALLFVAAFLVRLFYLNGMQELVTFDVPHMDELYHLELAKRILSPAGFPDEPFFRAPLYPYFFAGLYALAGKSLYWVRLIQIVLGSFLPLLMLGLGTRLFDRKVAWTAAIAAVVYPTFLYYDASLLITSLMTTLTTLLLWQLYRVQASPRLAAFALAGILLGMAGLARPNILLLGPVLAIWAGVIIRPELGLKRTVLRYAVMGVLAVLVIVPITVRNYAVSGEFIPIAWQGGFNFYLGNHTGATGWSASAPGLDLSWKGGYEESIAIAQAAEGRQLSKGEISAFWYDRAWEEIGGAPGAYVSLLVRKVRLLVNGYEIPNNQNIYIAREYVPWLKPLLFTSGIYFPFGIVMPLALIGIGFSLRRWRQYLLCYLLLGAYSVSLLLFFVCARFRQPMIPVLLLFAAYGVFELVRAVKERRGRTAVIAGVVLVALLIHSNVDMLGLDPKRTAAEDQFMIGTAYLTAKNYGKAEQAFKQAIAIDSTYAQSYANLGLVKIRQRQPRPAEGYFATALRLEPGAIEHYFNLATIKLELDKAAEAVTILERAATLKPFNDDVYSRLAEAYTRVLEMEKGRGAARRALELNPENRAAAALLQRIEQYLEKQS